MKTSPTGNPAPNGSTGDCDGKGTLRLVGKVVESSPPRRLVLTWAFPADEGREEKHSRVTFEIEPVEDVVRLTVTHDRLEPGSEMLEGHHEGLAQSALEPEIPAGGGTAAPQVVVKGRLPSGLRPAGNRGRPRGTPRRRPPSPPGSRSAFPPRAMKSSASTR